MSDVAVTPAAQPPQTAGGRRSLPPRVVARRWNIEVLLVEDDEADRCLIFDVLKRHPHVSTAHATDAPDKVLFDLANGYVRPGLILLDIHMPKLSGFKFLEALRGIPAMRDTPVVLLTTSRLARDVEEARISSASLYVVKPDTYEELQARLDGVIEQAITGAWTR
ncbi:MAG: response regulator [Terricaulis sp.]